MSQGRQHSFVTLFSDVETVEIPIIQRDYAQGREQAEDVRLGFLTALRDALLVDGAAPLDLDFVYGSFEADANKVLSLLDGQQRLTTLFLLHWYIAMREGKLEHFKTRWTRDGRSLFTYATRPSATEFFHALTASNFFQPERILDRTKLSVSLMDCNWFFLAWHSDPTVNSCLAMLDAIQKMFAGETGNLYPILLDEKQPRITFHFLNLHDFGLSDDLYIKMNARGKPLTPFENFKAWLVGRVAKESWATGFDANMDQKWMDFFWRLTGKQGGTANGSAFDDLFLRFMYVMAFFEACNRLDSAFATPKSAIAWITRLREARGYLPLLELESREAFGVATIQQASAVLDYFCGPTMTSADTAVVERALSPQHGYPDLVKLYALVAFIVNSAGMSNAHRAMARQRWDRVTSNLIANSRFDLPALAAAAVKGLGGLADSADRLYESLADNSAFTAGFNREQIAEEARKAALIMQDPTLEPLFIQAEAHNYLQGRIGFLIEFSQKADASFDVGDFERYSARARAVLDAVVLNSKEFLLERALLSIDDYLVNRGSSKFSFCEPNATTFRDRGENWLRVVGRPEFRLLLDRVGEDAVASLQKIIVSASCKDWRKYVVAEPLLIDYCRERLIHRGNSDIYLLSRTRLSGYFVELRSYALYCALQRDPGILGNVKLRYEAVYGDAQPMLVMTFEIQEMWVLYIKGTWCYRSSKGDVEPPAALERFIEEHGFND